MKQRHQSTKVKRWIGDLKHIVDEVHQMLTETAIDAQPMKLNLLLPARLVRFSAAFTSHLYPGKKEMPEKLEFL
jgi:hypothetical protein